MPASDYHLVKTELFDADVMDVMLRTKDMFSSDDISRLSKYKKGRKQGNSVEVIYHYGKGCEEDQLGRLYARGNMGLQAFPFDIRNPLLEKHYWDVDMENCHYYLLQHLGNKWGINVEGIKYYCDNRDECLKEVSSNRSTAKTAFLKVAYGGCIKTLTENKSINLNKINDVNEVEKSDTLNKIEKEVKAITNYVWSEYSKYHRKVSKKLNPKSSLLSLILQTEERKCILALDEYMKKQNRSMDILIHDGGEIRKLENEKEFPVELLRGGEEYIEKSTGYKMCLAVKPFRHSFVMPDVDVLIGSIPSKVYKNLKDEFEKTHFYMRSTNTVCEICDDGFKQFPLKHALTAFAGKYQYSYTNEKGEFKQHDLIESWIKDPERRQYNDMVFKPNTVCSDLEFNTFQGFEGARFKKGNDEKFNKANQIFVDIIRNLVNNNQEAMVYVIKWFCDMFQNPQNRSGVALILSGPQGVGKDTIGSLIGRLVGKKYYGHFEDAENQLFGAFNSQLEDKIFIHLEELQGFATRANSSKLKAFITKTDMLVNHKGIIPYQKDIYHRFFATTNEATPVVVEPGDRRYAIFFAGSANKGNHQYWKEANELFSDEEVLAGFYERFMTTDINGWNPRDIVETEEKKNLQYNEINYEEQLLIHIANSSEEVNTRYTNDDLYKEYVMWCNAHHLTPKFKNYFGRLLTPFMTKGWVKMGKSNGGRYVQINNKLIKDIIKEDDVEDEEV